MFKLLFSLILLIISNSVSSHNDRIVYLQINVDIKSELRFDLIPCEDLGKNQTTLLNSTDLPRDTENMYYVFVTTNFSDGKEVEVTLSSGANIYYDDGRYHLQPISNLTFAVINSSISTFSFLIETTNPAVLPYITTLKIDGKEYCKRGNIVNSEIYEKQMYQYEYLQDYRVYEQITLPVLDKVCGTRKVEHTGLPVNGLPTKPGDWPWHAAIYKVTKTSLVYRCGGTLISNYHILTAAQCVTNPRGSPISPDVISVVLGKYNLSSVERTAVFQNVQEIIVHEAYNFIVYKNDIALIKLSTKVEYNNYIQPACLWQRALNSKLPEPVLGTVVGWSVDHTNDLISQLQQVQIPKVNDATCLESNPAVFESRLDDTNFCAGYLNGTSVCNGYAGGGFTILIEGRYYVRGIVSFSLAKKDEVRCNPDEYVLFTDTEKYVSWIRTHVK